MAEISVRFARRDAAQPAHPEPPRDACGWAPRYPSMREGWPGRRARSMTVAGRTAARRRRGCRIRCRPLSLAWVGGRFSPSRCFRLRRRTDRRHRTQPRDACSRRQLELFQDLSRSRIDSPHIALVTFPGAVPELAVDPGDPGDDAVGLDGAKNCPRLGIDLMDLPAPMLPHPERPSAHASPSHRRRRAGSASTRPVFGSIFWMRSSAI